MSDRETTKAMLDRAGLHYFEFTELSAKYGSNSVLILSDRTDDDARYVPYMMFSLKTGGLVSTGIRYISP